MERTSMRNIREVLRLHHEQHLTNRQIARSCVISRESVRKYLHRAKAAQLPWPLPAALDDEQLENQLFPSGEIKSSELAYPDWSVVHQQLKKKGVTLLLLWEEHRAAHPHSASYSRFCEHYRNFLVTLEPVMRQHHVAGEKLFVDFSGLILEWIEPSTGEILVAQIFVAVLGASNYTYVEALPDQSLPSWTGAHVRAFEFFGGVPRIVVPDNLKAGVTKAHYYDPDINLTYQEMACHYGVAVVPTRVRAPKDKAKVEVGVQGIERRILAVLREHTFMSIADINAAMAPLLKAYNERPFQKLEGSRHSQFLSIDKPALKALPLTAYQYATWCKATVAPDYHVAFEKHYYSVPYTYLKKVVEVRISANCLEVFYKNKCIAVHPRSMTGGHTTVKEHMPKRHQAYVEWTPQRLINWASQIGVNTAEFITRVIDSRPLPQQAFRACLGILRLGDKYSKERLEKACARALQLNALRYQHIESILKNGLEEQPLPTTVEQPFLPCAHENVRGAEYYH
jgi:transposase